MNVEIPKKTALFLLGITNSGKSTLLHKFQSELQCGTVEVGKEMRRRHPPEYFKGRGAMQETEEEALQIFKQQFFVGTQADQPNLVVIDGQPRMLSQIEPCFSYAQSLGYIPKVGVLGCSDEKIKQRIQQRDTTRQAFELSMKRMVNDKVQLHEVLVELIKHKVPLAYLDSKLSAYNNLLKVTAV